MDSQNLAYALVQIVHNFGAITVVGAAAAALWLVPRQSTLERSLAWLVLLGWAAQIASGAGLGAVSLYYYGRFPDITEIARAALVLKVISAGFGCLLAALYLSRAARWSSATCRRTWRALTGLGVLALTAAAFLRWFS